MCEKLLVSQRSLNEKSLIFFFYLLEYQRGFWIFSLWSHTRTYDWSELLPVLSLIFSYCFFLIKRRVNCPGYWRGVPLVEIFLRISQKLSSIFSFFNFLRNSGRFFRFLQKVLDCLRKLQNKKFDIPRKAGKVQISQKF